MAPASVHLLGDDHHHLALLGRRPELAAHDVAVAVRQNLDRRLVKTLKVVDARHRLTLAHEGADGHQWLADPADRRGDVAVDVGGGDDPLPVEAP